MSDAALTTTTIAPQGGVLGRLLKCGWEFDFFQAVWLLERCREDKTPIGGRGPVAEERIRFRPHVSVGFPPTDVRRITAMQAEHDAEQRYRVDVTFMGLYGVSTPLPLHYAIEMLRSVEPYSPAEPAGGEQAEGASEGAVTISKRGSDTNPTRDFLDIFHHRLVSLFYRAWTKYRYDVIFGMFGRDTITDYLLWLIGCPRRYDRSVLGVSPIRLIRYAGLLTQHPKSAAGLEGLLFDYWDGVDIRIEQCIGRWVTLSVDDLNSIGTVNSTLGVDLTVGEQVYDRSGAFSISVGPVDWETYVSFLPCGERFAQTRALVQLYCSDPLAFTVEVKLHAREVPQMQLTSDDRAGRLGFTTWALTEEAPETSVMFDATSSRRIRHETDPPAPAAARGAGLE
jgi:type VI secretion system protein ImpH